MWWCLWKYNVHQGGWGEGGDLCEGAEGEILPQQGSHSGDPNYVIYIVNMDTGNINTILANTDIFDIRMKRQRQFSSPGLVPGPSCGGFDLCVLRYISSRIYFLKYYKGKRIYIVITGPGAGAQLWRIWSMWCVLRFEFEEKRIYFSINIMRKTLIYFS